MHCLAIHVKKFQKKGIKIRHLANSKVKLVYNFDIYYNKNLKRQVRMAVPRGKFGVTHEVVMKLAIGLKNKSQCIATNNCFTSISLFKELLSKGIYIWRHVIRKVKSNKLDVKLTSNWF